jgi:hypothetical protein
MNAARGDEEWGRLITQGETTHVDFKGPMAWDGSARGSLSKDVVAMANIRDGGVIVIGVSEVAGKSLQVDGVTEEQAATFDPTKVVEYIASRFQPPVRLQIERPIVDGKQLIAIRVAEFETTPIVCISDGPETAQGSGKRMFYEGNVFVRNAAAKSEPIRRAEDMHALIRLAVSKTGDQLLADFRRILDGRAERQPVAVDPHRAGLEVYATELKEHRSKWAAQFPGRGTFSMTFLPSQPIGKVLDHATMKKLVEQAQVEWRGWKVPTAVWPDRFSQVQNRIDAVQGAFDLDEYKELWQLRSTGAFMHTRLIIYVRDEKGGSVALPFEEVIYPVALGLRFAQRLYKELIPDGELTYEFRLEGIKGQRLGTFDDFRIHMRGTNYRASEDIIPARGTCSVLDLRSAWRPIAQRVLKELFSLFSWDIATSSIDQHLDKFERKNR